ncbi:hypothetical protein BT96DRAFT_949651 [Gymnopus androsaceus JB14]|uniref:Uncharacterized protein n=1 Tax=Gymnopus androsaceus JB14 TaxID=1447944 RepID=A0A6A4GJ23_9AGAR|nr:hypothetical protein BT96DRAFT_949651 [Gymnopus androsaceus JB14]
MQWFPHNVDFSIAILAVFVSIRLYSELKFENSQDIEKDMLKMPLPPPTPRKNLTVLSGNCNGTTRWVISMKSSALSASKPSTPDRSRHLNAKLHEQMLYSSSNIEIL